MTKKRVFSAIIKYIILLSLVGYLVFVVIKIVRPVKEVRCTGVDVRIVENQDNVLISRDDVEKILATHKIAPEGQPFSNVDIEKIDSILLSNPRIDSVFSYRNSAGKLCIRLWTAQPILHVIPSNGKEFYLERTGKIILGSALNTNLCIVTGSVSHKFATDNLVTLGTILNEDPYWKLQAQQINVTPSGEIQLVPRTGNHILILGEAENIPDKLRRIRAFYEKAMPKVGWDTYKTINAKYDGQLVCTKK